MKRWSRIKEFGRGVVLSYSSIFFSQSLWYGCVLLLLSFIYPLGGLCGLLSCLFANGFALLLGKDLAKVSTGIYGFNAVFTGLALPLFFPCNFLALFLLALLTLFLTFAFESVGERLRLPFLAFPFLFAIETAILLADPLRQMMEFVSFGEGDLLADVVAVQPFAFMQNWLLYSILPEFIYAYFQSFSSIFFQTNVFCGVIMAVALLCFSRMAFTLSFAVHTILYFMIGAVAVVDENWGIPFYSYGFNFILTSIAVGCYFVVPSLKSYLWALLLAPLHLVVLLLFGVISSYIDFSPFTFPFCIVTVVYLYVLGRKKPSESLQLAYYRENTPENTFYHYNYNRTSGRKNYGLDAIWPFMGEWTVSQGINGEYTHKGSWRYAWDFVVTDEKKRQYKGLGDKLTDYYCFRKPVVAPAAGVVAAVYDGLDDNGVGAVDTVNNWGNYIVLKHGEQLYSAVCHLQKGTIMRNVGMKVSKGDILALCGNSGYSPFPHLHFQFQAYPQMGAPTLDYRMGLYVADGNIVTDAQPQNGESISNLPIDESMAKAYSFSKGQTVKVSSELWGEERWTVEEDAWGGTYFYLKKKNVKAWFSCDGLQFRFLRYEGSEKCALYHFYCSNYHVPFVEVGKVTDVMSLEDWRGGLMKFLQDVVAPFWVYADMQYAFVKTAIAQLSTVDLIVNAKTARVLYRTCCKQHKISEVDIMGPNNIVKILFLN